MKIQLLSLLVHSIMSNVGIKYESGEIDRSGQTLLFDQLVDHMSFIPMTFKQRYTLYDDYFDATDGAVVLYICGESECDGLRTNSFAFDIARQTKAAILVLEHRFYGVSQPFPGPDALKTEYMERYLTVDQALEDLAYFISMVKLQELHGITAKIPWVHLGGSYPGALSAWFRFKHPSLTIGGLASSGVVNKILDFTMFDQQIHDSALRSGQYCVDSILALTELARLQLSGFGRIYLLKSFGAQLLNDGEFFFFLADTIVMQIQYGQRVEFCNSLMGKNAEQALEVVRQLSLKYSVKDYGSVYLRNQTFEQSRNARQWYFQTCLEMGWMQTPSNVNPMRPQDLSIKFWQNWCYDSYGLNSTQQKFWPDVNKSNNYWDEGKKVTNLIMTNGAEDPWKQASIVVPLPSSDIIVIEINANDIGHCSDLKSQQESDPLELVAARLTVLSKFQQWINEFKNGYVEIEI